MDRKRPNGGTEDEGHRPARADDERDARAFAASLRERGEAARALGEAVVRDAPMLYGSADMHGVDPGIAIARLHREEMVKRCGGGAPARGVDLGRNPLPFERGLLVFCVILMLVQWLA